MLVLTGALGQTVQGPDWRKIGGPSADLMLASPATGPVDTVWFSGDASRLYARTRLGAVVETLDYENWVPVSAPPDPPLAAPAYAERKPESAARLVAFPLSRGRVYALGEHLYRSDDGGRSWANLTAFRSESVIGGPQRSLAVSPRDQDEIVVANDFGVWRSMDGGLSWSGLNQFLPNLPATRILATPQGMRGARIFAGPLRTLELRPGTAIWQPVEDSTLAREEQTERQYAAILGTEITAVAAAGDTVYAGSLDGRIWASLDGGRTWGPASRAAGGVVERLWVDPAEPGVALAALSGPGPLVLRTTNSGGFWDDLSSALPASVGRAVTADRTSGTVYAATDKGVFYAHADLENPGNPQLQWTSLTTGLPAAGAWDVRLDPAGHQLYIAIEGYGVYAAMAPHRAAVLRLVSAADYSNRPAAPGSLLSVLGGRVTTARGGGLQYPVLAATDTESQIQVPFEAAGPLLALALETSRGSVQFPLAVQPVSPAIFIGRDGAAMLLDADSGLMLDAQNTAHSGTRIQVLATGLGKVVPDWPTGLAAPLENPPAVAASVKAYLDRAPVTVTRTVLAPGYVGFYLVEIQVPEVVNFGSAELYVTAGGQESNRVQIFLEP
jgi:uncharacterized protein (TIGR03437 family)